LCLHGQIIQAVIISKKHFFIVKNSQEAAYQPVITEVDNLL